MDCKSKQIVNDTPKKSREALLQGLYIHWPWCVSKCPYCDFNSHIRRVFDEDQYVEAICHELDHVLGLTGGLQNERSLLGSIFFGGGTPSLMRPQTVAALLDHVKQRFTLADDIEITLEANPSSVEADRFADLAGAGVNRLSLGVQALEDEALKVLGRAHGVQEALKAIKLARQHFPRMSFDLIYGRDRQELATWREELKRALDLCNGHLSLYQLTIEPGTQYKNLFERGRLSLPTNERAARFFHETREICEQAGLPAYEISNYAAPGQQSAHNLVYWRYGSYIGVGPGAHGRIIVDGKQMASAVIRSPKRWMAQAKELGHGYELIEPLDESQMADEMILMGMRLVEGLDLGRLRQLTGQEISAQKINELIEAGLCESRAGRHTLQATEQGFGVLNLIVEQLSLALQAV